MSIAKNDKHEMLRLSNQESNKLTREAIESALLLLMEQKEFHEITISEIVKRAGVSRTAYYRNYQSKEEILQALLQELIQEINGTIATYSFLSEQEIYWRTLFVTVRKHAQAFTAVKKAGFGHVILDAITEQMLSQVAKDSLETRYDMIFWSGAFYNVLARWIDDGLQPSEEAMVQTCLFIMENFDK
ncbi:TetR/AcrR family transcriptional regulator [Enterococcus olivae]